MIDLTVLCLLLYKKPHWKRKHYPVLGKKSGSWTICSHDIQISRHYGVMFFAECDCGKRSFVSATRFSTGRLTACKTCKLSKGFGDMPGWYFSRSVRSALGRNIEFDVDKEYLWRLYLQQDKKCAISGLPIHLYREHSMRKNITASLDRIDSKKGYIRGNLQWLHKAVNLMKLDHDQTEFINLCKIISSYNAN